MPNITDILDLCCCEKCPIIKATIGNDTKNPPVGPYNMENGLCKSEEKVKKIDSKVVEYFNIQEGIYVYKDLKNKVYSNINEEKFTDICKDCEWRNVTNCKELNLKKL